MDHPQPLLERRRGDDLGSVDAFSRAILGEKDPVVRGYMENLRSQIAAIAARHGANAREVWDRAVQDRMSLDEMERVNALFARIKAMAEKKLSRVDAGSFARELDEKADVARVVLAEELKELDLDDDIDIAERIAEGFVRAGFAEEALEFVDGLKRQIGPLARAKIQLASGHFDAAILQIKNECVRNVSVVRSESGIVDTARCLLDALDGKLRTLSDEEVAEEYEDDWAPFSWACGLILRRFREEYRRRGMDQPELTRDRLALVARREENATIDRSFSERFSVCLADAECDARLDGDPSASLERAENLCVAMIRGPRENVGPLYVEMAARLDRFDRVSSYISMGWEKSMGLDPGRPSLWMAAARGFALARNFDAAIDILRARSEEDGKWPEWTTALEDIAVALLDADEIGRAIKLIEEFRPDGDHTLILINRALLAARARRGEDVIADARDEIERIESIGMYSVHAHETIAQAAIATIGYTVAMKKRIAEYASKR